MVRGSCRVEYHDDKQKQVCKPRSEGIGSVVGLTEVLLDRPRDRDVTVESLAAEAYQIPGEVFRNLVKNSESVAVRVYQIIAASLAHRHGVEALRHKSHNELLRHFRHSEVEFSDPGEEVRVDSEAFAVKGDFAEVALDGRIVREVKAPHHLTAGAYTSVTAGVILHTTSKDSAGRFTRHGARVREMLAAKNQGKRRLRGRAVSQIAGRSFRQPPKANQSAGEEAPA